MIETTQRVLLLPKNRGLAVQAERAIGEMDLRSCSRVYVRGEDVPYITGAIAAAGRPAVGITGEDLLAEWLAAGNALDESLRLTRVPWDDPRAIYGKPALCLIGARDTTLGTNARIAICAKYRNLADRYVRTLEAEGHTIESVVVRGALENVCLQGLADFIIDIVVTGRTVKEAGLEVKSVISTSDLAVLEGH